MLFRAFGMMVVAAVAAAVRAGDLPRVWATYDTCRDMMSDFRAMKAGGVDCVTIGCRSVEYCREALEAAKATGIRLNCPIGDLTRHASMVERVGLKPEPAVMIGGAYDGKAIDRHLFAFAAEKHEIVIEPPIYDKGFPVTRGRTGMEGDKVSGKPEKCGHYFPGVIPLRAEVVVPLKAFDGEQHLRILPAKLDVAPADAKPSNDSVTNPQFFTTREYRERKLYRLSFDLTGLDGALLDKVGLAVYWAAGAPGEDYKAFSEGQVAPAAESTREALQADVRRRFKMWTDANGGTFPFEQFVGVRYGDECFNMTFHTGAPFLSFPLWDMSEPGLAAFRKVAGDGVEHPRTWGYPEIYGEDAYACFLYAYHKSCAELAQVVRDEVKKVSPDLLVFRNTTRNRIFALSNEHDGTGQELLAQVFDFLHLDPYPVSGGGYSNVIPMDMGYMAGLARRYKKPLIPWMQAHVYGGAGGLKHVTAADVKRMGDEHWNFGIDGIFWLGWGNRYTFPNASPEGWTAARDLHRRLHAELPPKPKARIAVLRPYSKRAIASTVGADVDRNPADKLLWIYTTLLSEEFHLPYDVFEIPPRESLAERKAREEALKAYAYVVSTVPYPGAIPIGIGSEGKTLSGRGAEAAKTRFRREIATLFGEGGKTVFSMGFDERTLAGKPLTSPFLSDDAPSHPGTWLFANFERRLTMSVGEEDGEKRVELKLDREDCDTLFSLRSEPFPVTAGSGFRLTCRLRGTYSMATPCGQWGRGGTYIGWLDAQGNRLSEQFHFGLAADDSAWQDVSVVGRVPDAACAAFVDIGADAPNFRKNERLCLAKVTFSQVPVNAVPLPGVVRPAPLVTDLAPGVEPLKTGVVTLRDDGMTLIDGKPFFPIGIYSVHRCAVNSNDIENAFRQLKDAGFNTVHTYDWKRGESYSEYQDMAEKYGMRLLNNPVSPLPKTVTSERARPNMLAWYLADDASKRMTPEQLRMRSLTVKRYDNAHLTAQADSLGSDYRTRYADFIGSTDVFLPEIYTACGSRPNGYEVLFVDYQVRAVFRELREAGVVKGVWPILQQFKGWKGWQRFPTAEEVRAMAYLSISAGAHGLFWYTYAAANGDKDGLGAADDPDRWRDLAAITRELASIQDDLGTRSAAAPQVKVLEGPEKDSFGNASVHCVLKQGVGGRLLIAVNAAAQKVRAQFAIDTVRKAQVLFEDREVRVASGLVDEFEPNGVHVYRLR